MAVHEALHANGDRGIPRRRVRDPRVRQGQLVHLVAILLDVEVEGVDLDPEPDAREPVRQDDEEQEQSDHAGEEGARRIGEHLQDKLQLLHGGPNLDELKEAEPPHVVPHPSGRAGAVRAHDAEDDRERQHQDRQSRDHVPHEAVPQVVPLDEVLVHHHRPELVVPDFEVDEDVGDEDEVDDQPVEQVKVLLRARDDPVVVEGRKGANEWNFQQAAEDREGHDAPPDLGRPRRRVDEALVALLRARHADGLELHLENRVLAELGLLVPPHQGNQNALPPVLHYLRAVHLVVHAREAVVPLLLPLAPEAGRDPAEPRGLVRTRLRIVLHVKSLRV
mmetsp:Transcript_35641/g.77533  ORF Transcript_35641/g.77533 Transcript_35641/m.77533 type:complete len:334 (-) Transcript_35641:178-1179(-)